MMILPFLLVAFNINDMVREVVRSTLCGRGVVLEPFTSMITAITITYFDSYI